MIHEHTKLIVQLNISAKQANKFLCAYYFYPDGILTHITRRIIAINKFTIILLETFQQNMFSIFKLFHVALRDDFGYNQHTVKIL